MQICSEIVGALFMGVLVAAAFMDIVWQEVYDFLWILGIVLAGIQYALSENPGLAPFAGMVFFIFVQEVIMAKAYGKADCHCYSCCAFMLVACGYGFEDIVVMMGMSFAFLVSVQLRRRNIGSRGKLKEAVPMIPYILASYTVLTAGKVF